MSTGSFDFPLFIFRSTNETPAPRPPPNIPSSTEHFIEETFVEKEALEATVYTPLAIKILLCYVLSRFSALDSARVALLKGAVVAEVRQWHCLLVDVAVRGGGGL